jgi:hypothetical protein
LIDTGTEAPIDHLLAAFQDTRIISPLPLLGLSQADLEAGLKGERTA